MGKTSPDNIEFVEGTSPFQRVADLRVLANSVQNAITAFRTTMNSSLAARPTTTTMNAALATRPTNSEMNSAITSAVNAAKVSDSGWVSLALPSGYTRVGETALRKRGNRVEFRGGFTKNSGAIDPTGWNQLINISSAYRPSTLARGVIPGHSTPTGVNILMVEVLTNGDMRVATVGTPTDTMNLSTFSYSV